MAPLLLVTGTIIIIIVLSSSLNYGFFEAVQAHNFTIPVRGTSPYGITYNPVNNNMYVANQGSSTVSVISGSNDSVILSGILVGKEPSWVVHTPLGNKLYVTNQGSSDVYVIDGATNKVIKNIPVGNEPLGIVYNPFNNNVYVANNDGGTVSVINTSTDTVIKTIKLSSVFSWPSTLNPFFLDYVPYNTAIYTGGFQQVSAINTVTDAAVKDSLFPFSIQNSTALGLAYNSNNNRIYITTLPPTSGPGMVFRINPDTNDFEGTAISVGLYPIDIAHNPTNNNMYVSNAGSDTVSVINSTTNSVIATIPTGLTPVGIAYNANNGHIYVNNAGSNSTTVIHP